MRFFYIDASALAKRYAYEVGTPLLNHLFARVTLDRLYVFTVGMAEVASLLVRKKNAGMIAAATFARALVDFRAEVLAPTILHKIEADIPLVTAAISLIEKHSINATDAILLRSALDIAVDLRSAGDDLVLMASDQRLLRAAQAEGLTTFNPEMQAQADLDALL